LGAAHLVEAPSSRTLAVAMSTAQGDGGVFDLNFRDERYMPFEGAGAVSSWRLELPAGFRPFDYRSITDVILNLSYTAEEDGVLRQAVMVENAAVEGTLLQFLNDHNLVRVLSLRQEYSSAYNRLVQAAAGTAVTIDIGERHFPLFLQGRVLNPTAVELVLATSPDQAVDNVALTVNGAAVNGFVRDAEFGGLPHRAALNGFGAGLMGQHTLTVTGAGQLAAGGGVGAPLLDTDRLHDILLVIAYTL
jgi:hypothetical protein